MRSNTQTPPAADPAAVLSDGAMTVEAAVRFSGIGRTGLYRLMTAGRLPFVQQGRRRLIPRKALVAVLTEGLVPADPG